VKAQDPPLLQRMKPTPAEFSTGQLLQPEVLKRFLKNVGKNVAVYHGSRFVGAENIEIGDFSQIDEGVRIFGGLGVRIGRHVHMAFESSISGGGECVLEDFVGIAAGVRIITGSEELSGGLTNPTVPGEFRAVTRGRVLIGAHALVFTNSVVLPGVIIGSGAVVSAGALVHRDLKPWTIYAGNPLVQVGLRDPKPILDKAELLLKTERA
jgi:acetyltransferase-like isoleucine patch superfamily enzyme